MGHSQGGRGVSRKPGMWIRGLWGWLIMQDFVGDRSEGDQNSEGTPGSLYFPGVQIESLEGCISEDLRSCVQSW